MISRCFARRCSRRRVQGGFFCRYHTGCVPTFTRMQLEAVASYELAPSGSGKRRCFDRVVGLAVSELFRREYPAEWAIETASGVPPSVRCS